MDLEGFCQLIRVPVLDWMCDEPEEVVHQADQVEEKHGEANLLRAPDLVKDSGWIEEMEVLVPSG
jgi:hypothetical protein